MTNAPFTQTTPTTPPPAATGRARPTVRELPADLLTPVAAFLRVRHRGPGFLLESVERGQQVGRYSFMAAGCEPLKLDAASGSEPLRSALARHADVDLDGLPAFCGGVMGYVAYDAACVFEPTVPLPRAREGDEELLGRFLFAPVVVAFDHVRQTLQVVAQPGYDRAADELCADLLGHTGRLRGDGAGRAGAHRARRRVPDGALAVDRAPDRRQRVLALSRAARSQPVALHGVLRPR
jgi:anthranilate/para-aminobenzoate synthase component I